MDRYEPIDRICRYIDALPADRAWGREQILAKVCMVLGIKRARTGVEWSEDRPFKHLFWDHDTAALRARLVELMDDTEIDPMFLITGVLGTIEHWLRVVSDPAHTQYQNLHKAATLELMLAEKERPMHERKVSRTDDEIDDLVARLRDDLPSPEAMERAAAEGLRVFLPTRAEQFSYAFWHEYNAARLREGLEEFGESGGL